MASRTMHLFSIGQDALKKIAAHLHGDTSEGGDWCSPEKLFRDFLQKLAEEMGDTHGFCFKDEEFVEGEIRFSVECSDEIAAKVMEVLNPEEPDEDEDQGA